MYVKNWQTKYRVNVPEGTAGHWSVKRIQMDKALCERANFHMTLRGEGYRYITPGTYTMLQHAHETVMSDTPAEIRDHLEAIKEAANLPAGGKVLINGLGLGMVLNAMLIENPALDITVIEQAPEVAELVWPHYTAIYGDRIRLVQADALTWRPPKGTRYGVVWHDIWSYITRDNLPEMKLLHRAYGRRTDWQGSWARWQCERGR